jgi:hypothetical protein
MVANDDKNQWLSSVAPQLAKFKRCIQAQIQVSKMVGSGKFGTEGNGSLPTHDFQAIPETNILP